MKNRSRLAIFTTILSGLACLVLLPQMRAAQTEGPLVPENFSGSNTFDGFDALHNQTANTFNSAFGWLSLRFQTTAEAVTGCGAGTLVFNTADNNSAFGAAALQINTTGTQNVALGGFAQLHNNTGSQNTAVGFTAMENSAGGSVLFNTAVGFQALQNVTANANAAVGDLALMNLTSGHFNTAIGAAAGINSTTGQNNVYIGQGSFGVAGESNTTYLNSGLPTTAGTSKCFIGGIISNHISIGSGTPVVTINTTTGQLGWGGDFLTKIAEQQKQIEEQQASINQLKSEMQTMVAQLKDQAAQIQKVSARLEVSKPAPQVVANKP